jgi:hypothetical protein
MTHPSGRILGKSGAGARVLVLALAAGAAACGGPADDAGGANGTATVQAAFSADDLPKWGWDHKTDAKDAITMLYSGINFYLCTGAGVCPESDAHREATRIIDALSTTIIALYVDDKIADAHTLVDMAAAAFAHPDQLLTNTGAEQAQAVVWKAIDVYDHFRDVLNATDPTDPNQVKIAYALASWFNVVAAVVDNVAQLAQQYPLLQVPPNWAADNRRDTLATDEALVGAQSLWYSCPGASTPTMVSTVQTFDNSLPTKKLWMKFANYDFSVNSMGDTWKCNVSRRVTAPNDYVCYERTACEYYLICHANSGLSNQEAYAQELPKILAAMNRDTTVVTVRTAMARLVDLAADHGSGLLVRAPSGNMSLWQIWSRHSYRSTPLSSVSPDWQPITTGDFNGDGVKDVLWRNCCATSIWFMSPGGISSAPPTTPGAPLASKAFAGDLDGDGISDVVWVFSPDVSGYSTLTWMMSSGSVTPRATISGSSRTDMVQGLGDFDNDSLHRADVLLRNPSTGTVSIQLNGGAPTVVGSPTNDWQIEGVGDFNGDHYADILWYNTTSGAVSVWAMQGAAIIGNPVAGGSPPSAGWSIQGVADVDHDGISDIVWQHSSGMIGTWIMAGPSSVRDMSPPYNVPAGTTVAGVIDLGPPAPANAPAAPITETFCNAPTGQLRNSGFADYEQWWGGSFYGSPGTFLGDVDGDTKADLIGLGSNYVGVTRSTGSGFGGYETWMANTINWNGSHGSLVGDIDGDAKADVFVLNNGSVQVLRSTGSSFQELTINGLAYSLSPFYGSHATVIGDIDGDRRSELVALDDSTIRVLRWTGSGPPTTSSQPGTFYGSHGTFLGDIDGDGKADLVGLGDGYVGVLRSVGTSFGAYETWSFVTFYGSKATYLADVDGDGRADLVAVDADGVRVMRAATNSFGPVENWWGQGFYGSHATVIGDIDGNGKADLVGNGDGYVGAIRSE